MPLLDRALLDRLTVPGPRLPWLAEWLMEDVWSSDRYADLGPLEYLQQGEKEVNAFEELLAAAAWHIYDELLTPPSSERDVSTFLEGQEPRSAVVFDGLSLREVPAVLRLAEQARLEIQTVGFSLAAVPGDTMEYVEQRLGAGRVAPSQLPSRRELAERGIKAYYYSHQNQQHRLEENGEALLLWSAFPDNMYADTGARFPQYFEQIHSLLETAWLNTIQQVPKGRQIVITSDHGYVFFGSGLSFARDNEELRPLRTYLAGERFRRLGDGTPPPEHPDLAVLEDKGVAVIRGRVQTHPPGPGGSRLYKHGGLSLMEMLTPWIVLEGRV